MPHTLTGKELKFAAENKVPVEYEERYHNPSDRHMNFKGERVMKRASHGLYIGNSDIDPKDFESEELVIGEFPEGTFKVMAAKKQTYQ